MTLGYIRDTYQVPAYRGGQVRFEGQVGRILSAHGPHLRVLFEDGHRGSLHPTAGVEYLGREGLPLRILSQQELELRPGRSEPQGAGLALPSLRPGERRHVEGATNQERLLDYLRRYGSITQAEATQHLGDTRLASTVHKLTRKGQVFHREQVALPTRWGTTATVTRYSLLKGGN